MTIINKVVLMIHMYFAGGNACVYGKSKETQSKAWLRSSHGQAVKESYSVHF
jgi:hypothetical protein